MWVLSILLISLWYGQVELQEMTTIRWIDHIDDNMDIFFDRVVIITVAPTHKGYSLGVFITSELILTSYNPFRALTKIKGSRKNVTISVLYGRQIFDWKEVSYTLQNYTIACGRQVIPVHPKSDIWHSNEPEHSPLHDLMVIRLNERVGFLPRSPHLYSFDQYGQRGKAERRAGPMRTQLAKPHDLLGRDLKFASLGFINRRHINQSSLMRSHTFDAEDNVETNCDSWIPRQWGLFICIRNVMNFKAMGSGALLIHNHRLFGIGSFMLKKGNDSIFVFTDVREYYHLLRATCTKEDQDLKPINGTEYVSKEDYHVIPTKPTTTTVATTNL